MVILKFYNFFQQKKKKSYRCTPRLKKIPWSRQQPLCRVFSSDNNIVGNSVFFFLCKTCTAREYSRQLNRLLLQIIEPRKSDIFVRRIVFPFNNELCRTLVHLFADFVQNASYGIKRNKMCTVIKNSVKYYGIIVKSNLMHVFEFVFLFFFFLIARWPGDKFTREGAIEHHRLNIIINLIRICILLKRIKYDGNIL